jgi:hypothetical protein
MEIEVKDFFAEQLLSCPDAFQNEFKKVYLHLEIADYPLEVKNIKESGDTGFFKIFIKNSRIGLQYNKKLNKCIIICFLYNEYF